ncbi:hypothetical protein ACLI4Q_08145 [Natrialbaceae archaeon A-CW1-1]
MEDAKRSVAVTRSTASVSTVSTASVSTVSTASVSTVSTASVSTGPTLERRGSFGRQLIHYQERPTGTLERST